MQNFIAESDTFDFIFPTKTNCS